MPVRFGRCSISPIGYNQPRARREIDNGVSPYVSGFVHDLFLSYSHNDSAEWIHALEESLRQQLWERLGAEVHIWQDENKIRFGQNWCDEIRNGIRSSAGFLAVLSPVYRNSDWCAEESKVFLEHCEAHNELKAGSFYRFLKLVKLPWPGNVAMKNSIRNCST